jgi:hypothetical protein
MFWAFAAANQAALPPRATLVLTALAYHANERSGRAWPSVATLAAETRLSARTVVAALVDIECSGLLVCRRQRGRPTLWIFDPTPADSAPPPLQNLHRPLQNLHPLNGDRGADSAPEPMNHVHNRETEPLAHDALVDSERFHREVADLRAWLRDVEAFPLVPRNHPEEMEF